MKKSSVVVGNVHIMYANHGTVNCDCLDFSFPVNYSQSYNFETTDNR